jgi:hypothetical protein
MSASGQSTRYAQKAVRLGDGFFEHLTDRLVRLHPRLIKVYPNLNAFKRADQAHFQAVSIQHCALAEVFQAHQCFRLSASTAKVTAVELLELDPESAAAPHEQTGAMVCPKQCFRLVGCDDWGGVFRVCSVRWGNLGWEAYGQDGVTSKWVNKYRRLGDGFKQQVFWTEEERVRPFSELGLRVYCVPLEFFEAYVSDPLRKDVYVFNDVAWRWNDGVLAPLRFQGSRHSLIDPDLLHQRAFTDLILAHKDAIGRSRGAAVGSGANRRCSVFRHQHGMALGALEGNHATTQGSYRR